MGVPFVDAAELARLLPYGRAVDILARGFVAERASSAPQRGVVDVPGGQLLLMPAAGVDGIGIKLVTVRDGADGVFPSVQGVYVLFAPDSLAPALLIDGAALTARRTATVSALATRALARPDASRLVVFGAGVQARAHVAAMRAVRPIDSVTIVGRSLARARALVAELGADGLAARVGDAGAVVAADIICTCTTSVAPLFAAEAVAPGTHINAIGAHRAEMAELPGSLLASALLTVDDRSAVAAEGGDVIAALASGAISEGDIAGDLTALARSEVVRAAAEQITVFKSVGSAAQDLILAIAVAERRDAV